MTNNKDSINASNRQVDDVINRIKDDRKKLEQIETVEEAKAIAESEEKIVAETEKYIHEIDEKLVIASENFDFALSKTKELEEKVEALRLAAKDAKASSEAVMKKIDTIEKRIDEIAMKLAWIEFLIYATLGTAIITGVLVWMYR